MTECALPALRDDLQMTMIASTGEGEPCWRLYDPLMHRYFQLGAASHAVFATWTGPTTIQVLRQAIGDGTGLDVDAELIATVAAFAEANELTVSARGGWQAYAHRAKARKPNALMWLIHNYLFIKVPLFRPQRFLTRTLPFVEPLYTRRFAIFVAVVSVLGLYLVSRQSQVFFATFPHFFSLGGALLYALTLVVVKAVHEFGHAYTATRFKCRVPTMGVAFLVMVPMLYSEITDSWKLQSRRQRMAIDAAGVAAELVLAGFAGFLWAFLPDGTARSVAFLVATTSWIASVAINLSPFMRFDGYFLLSDLLGVANLQPRAFALGRWWLREILFDLRAPAPELLTIALRCVLIAYAYAVWLYRLVVFLGIAVLVYHYFFKVLGIILFGVEVGWFVARPFYDEIRAWTSMRHEILSRRRYIPFAGLLATGFALFVIPWSGRIEVAAIVEPTRTAHVFPTAPARIAELFVVRGQKVAAGDPLARLQSAKIDHEIELAVLKRALVIARLDRRAADRRDRGETLPLETERALLDEKLAGLAREADGLIARAPIDGTVVELDPDLAVGRWIASDEEIATIVDAGPLTAQGYVSQDDLARIDVGDPGTFAFDDSGRRGLPVRVEQIAYAAATQIDLLPLASTYGGPIAARENAEHKLVPESGLHRVTLQLPDSDRTDVSRGVAVISGARYSLAAGMWQRILRVLVRESGF